ncbi:UbiD family decarboxylase [Raoultella ornithinolytica]|uniref:UbiD family decarboxylase n=1 Tax=Raoultella ornithinolytica TaxID=54291 RepID=UPI000907E05E|nr:UbiD family decarboxylase [Raoultella ornithinolytica]EKX4888925.1 UbiD family decarboxylase [Raoultella ornithinolytica]ELT0603162.1 UbiD family decarboxylase [Raoultella ornithinolytica]ELT0734512.1 UbiD family decarboxylase [Raoultella ornithinolytica]QCK79791.1 UbiD family decarboxylase [Raoultella ornithinolytica]VTN61179.1 3-octaprenyl-4-hydroxybenzoate carboxy-lyase [Raoultella ornithinolytica]
MPQSEKKEHPTSLRTFLKSAPIMHRVIPMLQNAIAADYARRYAGSPACGRASAEPIVRYVTKGGQLPVLIGCYGNEQRVRKKIRHLPQYFTTTTLRQLMARTVPPQLINRSEMPAENPHYKHLNQLPVLTHTPNDAGAYITQGFIYAHDQHGHSSLSAHRLLLLDEKRLGVSILPGRQLATLHQHSLKQRTPLALSINIGIPPAAVIASSLSTTTLPTGLSKLAFAGALAGLPIRLAPCRTQDVSCLADSEIILEGSLGDELADESAAARYSMPEFAGYPGKASRGLAVFTLSHMRVRTAASYPALIGPGREQAVQLGLAGAFNALLGLPEALTQGIADLRYTHAGGGMLLLYIAMYPGFNQLLHLQKIATNLITLNPFTKLVVFVDQDINLQSDEDVLWAITTRCRLEADCHPLANFSQLEMDPSQKKGRWRQFPLSPAQKIWINATIPAGTATNFQRAYSELT